MNADKATTLFTMAIIKLSTALLKLLKIILARILDRREAI